jgi:hypothetical protein
MYFDDRSFKVKKSAMLFALLITFSLAVSAQVAPTPADGASTTNTTSPVKHAKIHHKLHHKAHHKAIKTETANSAVKTPAESAPVAK